MSWSVHSLAAGDVYRGVFDQGSAQTACALVFLPPRVQGQVRSQCLAQAPNRVALPAICGTPAVSVGSRQHDRECGPNVVFTSHDPVRITEAVRAQIAHGRYQRSELFGSGTAGRDIAEVLATVTPQSRNTCTTTQPPCSPTGHRSPDNHG